MIGEFMGFAGNTYPLVYLLSQNLVGPLLLANDLSTAVNMGVLSVGGATSAGSIAKIFRYVS